MDDGRRRRRVVEVDGARQMGCDSDGETDGATTWQTSDDDSLASRYRRGTGDTAGYGKKQGAGEHGKDGSGLELTSGRRRMRRRWPGDDGAGQRRRVCRRRRWKPGGGTVHRGGAG
ncbi:hypothetical protein E2562_027358 [Oryza meyeriana var. granulata]|uniref:DUF834 domain-containing protein n=1 Tax=Oryza meyeriana var. granulata TaxID=110450 RepID=A0A6G1C9S2_9ORYZ|nr:hypothetical protein E2562_027358 [Oryza meyeriana var. granulata]